MSINVNDLHAFYYYQPETGARADCVIYPNFNDLSYSQQVRSISKEDLLRTIREMLSYTCSGLVSESYISSQMSQNRIIVILYDRTKTISMPSVGRSRSAVSTVITKAIPMGFILASKTTDGEFYIDVICSSPGYGSHLLKFFIKDAESNKGALSIGLSALPHVLTFYPRFGFTHRRSCNVTAEVQMPERIKERVRSKQPLPVTIDATYEDDDFAAFMTELRNHGYGETDGECSVRPLTKQALKNGACGKNGYYMKYCAAPRSQQQPPSKRRPPQA